MRLDLRLLSGTGVSRTLLGLRLMTAEELGSAALRVDLVERGRVSRFLPDLSSLTLLGVPDSLRATCACSTRSRSCLKAADGVGDLVLEDRERGVSSENTLKFP
jgi:hypothetical protein